MISGEDIVAEARAWIGTPWKHAQALKGVGCDCIGLVGGVAANVGITDDWMTDASRVFKGYGRLPEVAKIEAGCAKWMNPVAFDRLQLGDILVMRFEKEPQHFGILSQLHPRYMVHAYAQARRVGENRIDEIWSQRIVAAFRFKGVA